MTKCIYQIFAVAVIACALTFSAVAQPLSGSSFGIPAAITNFPTGQHVSINAIGLVLRTPELVRMLELTPQQTAELQKIVSETAETLRALVQASTRLDPAAQNREEAMQRLGEMSEEMRQRAETVVKESAKKIDQILKPKQLTKFREFTFQLVGGLDSSIQDGRLLEFLDLTDTQKESIRKLVEERNTAMVEINQNIAEYVREPEALRRLSAEMRQMRAKFTEQLQSLLTSEQWAKAEKLTAEIPALRERLGLPPQGQPRVPDAGR